MTSELPRAEAQLKARGVVIAHLDPEQPGLGNHLETHPHHVGFIHLVPEGESAPVNVLLVATVPGERRERFAAWISEKIDRFFEHGAEPDGWQSRRSDGAWQL